MTLLQYLYDQYNRTKWPYFSSRVLINKFGREELNDLKDQGLVKRVIGLNHPVVRLLVNEKGEEIIIN
jgi:hypothetical protein